MQSNLNKSDLLKNFAIGFLPIFIFIVADEMYGTKTGLIAAILSGLAYLIYYFIRFKQVEKMILLDTALIVSMGSISLIFENDLFFKLKPALIELILVIILGIHAFSSRPILLDMQKRYLGEIEMPSAQIQMLKRLSRLLFLVILLHTMAIIYTAYFSSKEVWAFVSGGLFYILFGIILAGQWIYMKFIVGPRKVPDGSGEWVDLVDQHGKTIGKAPRSQVHGNPEFLHAVVHLHIFDKKGRLFLQKRAANKDLYPNYWDTAVGGHMSSGESLEQALIRETKEELGILSDSAQLIYRYIMRNAHESELVYTFRMKSDGPFELNQDEISEGRFWTLFEIEKFLGQNVFTPNFEQEFKMLKDNRII